MSPYSPVSILLLLLLTSPYFGLFALAHMCINVTKRERHFSVSTQENKSYFLSSWIHLQKVHYFSSLVTNPCVLFVLFPRTEFSLGVISDLLGLSGLLVTCQVTLLRQGEFCPGPGPVSSLLLSSSPGLCRWSPLPLPLLLHLHHHIFPITLDA